VTPSAPGGATTLEGLRILVTGGSGFIGRHVVSDLSSAGARVRVLDLQPHPDPGVDLVQGDMVEPDVLDAALQGGVDGVVHLAAVTSVLRSVEHPVLTYRTNVEATSMLLEGARSAGATSLVFASTNAVTGPMRGPAITESEVLQPLTPYGATKAAGEMLMSAYVNVHAAESTRVLLLSSDQLAAILSRWADIPAFVATKPRVALLAPWT